MCLASEVERQVTPKGSRKVSEIYYTENEGGVKKKKKKEAKKKKRRQN